MTDNGSCYRSKTFARACTKLGIKHIKTKPYTPQTNGKAERFIQTALREWAYATAFEHSDQRRQALLPFLHRYNCHRPHASGRLGARSDADLAWETELLQHLDREGLTVPVPIPTTDGRLFADGLVVMTYVEGGPPETEADWRRVADTLRRLHRLTQGWPQRPGWRSSTDLLHAETGTKIDLGAMPPEGVARCRAAWARLIGRQTCVVHGNPNNPGNVRMTANRVALIDWDESHVDVPDLDLVVPAAF